MIGVEWWGVAAVGVWLAVSIVILWFLRCLIDTDTDQMMEEFIRKFPGKCVICSWQRYGYTHCLTDSSTPPRHYCIEREDYYGVDE